MKPPFVLFGLSHVAAVFLILTLFLLVIIRLQRVGAEVLQNSKFHFWLVTAILSVAIGSKAPDILRNEFSLSEDLPFHLCGITPYLLAVYFLKPKRRLFNVLFYWIIGGSSLALIFPEIALDFPTSEFVLFFVSHSLPLFVVVYLVAVQGKRPSVKGSWHAFITLNFYALGIVLPVNLLTGGNYLYLFQVPTVNFDPIHLLPPWPWYLLVLEAFMLGLFRMIGYPFVRLARRKEVQAVA